MAYKWIDEKSCLHHKGRFFQSGDKIPAGVLTEDRADYFIRKNQIEEIGLVKEDDPVIASKKIPTPQKVYVQEKRGRKKSETGLTPIPVQSEPSSLIGE